MSGDYDPMAWEKKWQQYWEDNNIYHFDPQRGDVYSIDNPPRYASGALHIGHAVHYTHIDFVARYKRMRGYNVFFPLCFDVNGIPIEERVEKRLGITRKDIDRHEFIQLCREFAEENIGEMKRQFVMLGESMDPSIYYQTDAEYYRRVTQISFIDLYEKGYIYRGEFPVNWCPRCMTAMADAEIEHTARDTQLSTIKFYFADEQPEQIEKYHGIGRDRRGQYIEIATTRPEMLPTCQIVAVHPDDERAPWLVGQRVKVPLFGQEVEIVGDDSVDPSFGSGMLMVCTIGDKDDLEKALRYQLPMKICIDEEGRMNALAQGYQGLTIPQARQAVISDMEKQGLILKQQDIDQSVGICWRCKTPVEFIQAEQWFLKLLPFKEKVLEAADAIDWYPDYMQLRFNEWVNSLKWDWVISRQRYFATPIPLWECQECGQVVLATREQCYVDPTIDSPPVDRCPACGGPLKGSEDVFDTWMDSSVTPLYNTFWQRNPEMFERLYPMSLRPQAHDIIRTWAFYTVLRCLLITGEKPFREIMMGGFILAPDGKPMHTSLGNVIDPLEILREEGADPLRYYAAKCKLGEDNPFRPKDLVRGKRLMKKLWSVQQFVGTALQQVEQPAGEMDPDKLPVMDRWILTLFSRTVTRCTDHLDVFAYAEALREAEYFLWHEFADHYIEMVKHRIYDQGDPRAAQVLYLLGLGTLKLLAPFLPHIAEEIYRRHYRERDGHRSIHRATWPQPVLEDEEACRQGELVKNIIAVLREGKSSGGIPLNEVWNVKVEIFGNEHKVADLAGSENLIQNILKIREIDITPGMPDIEEIPTKIKPDYSKMGPACGAATSQVVNYLNQNINKTYREWNEKNGIDISDFAPAGSNIPAKIPKEYVDFEKEFRIKGKRAALINLEDIIIAVEG
ncbi:MAG TPA: valine--tRNA ligase [Thermoplasmatales archaeon]|nr:valine--tRNA ligase [Thermoplasmatales archaeon]